MSNVIEFSGKSNSSAVATPKQLLEAAIKQIDAGKLAGSKALVIILDEHDELYHIQMRQSGMKWSEVVALVAAAERVALNQMGF